MWILDGCIIVWGWRETKEVWFLSWTGPYMFSKGYFFFQDPLRSLWFFLYQRPGRLHRSAQPTGWKTIEVEYSKKTVVQPNFFQSHHLGMVDVDATICHWYPLILILGIIVQVSGGSSMAKEWTPSCTSAHAFSIPFTWTPLGTTPEKRGCHRWIDIKQEPTTIFLYKRNAWHVLSCLGKRPSRGKRFCSFFCGCEPRGNLFRPWKGRALVAKELISVYAFDEIHTSSTKICCLPEFPCFLLQSPVKQSGYQ